MKTSFHKSFLHSSVAILFLIIQLKSGKVQAQLWLDVGGGVNGVINGSYVDSATNLLYVVGGFDSAGGALANKIAVWDSINWMPFGDNSEFKNPGTLTSVIKYNGDIIVAGLFDSIGNNAIQNIARWDGNAWQPLGDKFDNTIYELEIYNGSLYAGGAFFHYGSDFCRHIAKWNGQIWTEVGSGLDNSVISFCVYKNKLICGGSFSGSDTISTPCIATWNDTVYSTLGAGFTGSVYRVRVLDDTLYATGNFQSWSGNPSNYLSKWDEVMWQAMPYPTGGQNSIIDACIFENNFYLVGYFTNPPDLAIWNGSQYDSLGNIYGFAKTYTIYKNELYVMGSFLSISNHVCNSIAKLNSLHIGVEELNSFTGTINIFPNPVTSNEIFIQSPDANLNLENTSVRLFNLQGKMVLSDKIRKGNFISLKNRNVSNGVYFIQIRTNNQTINARLVIIQN